MKPFLAVLVTAVMIACGKDSTGPIPQPSLTGKWTYADSVSFSGDSGYVVICKDNSLVFTLTQTDSTFAGSSTGGTELCTDNQGGSSDVLTWPPVVLIGTVIATDSVQFTISYQGTPIFLDLGGRISSDRRKMSGQVVLVADSITTWRGVWSLSKQ